ncbi:MAG: 3-phosphoshikimate 1-carboxyvinyltransferase [Pseudomonadota bacterium]|nr:3-phosphoshikimate 1-carboxyvinyltransferase [Pseudomonadota bacterium]
MTRVANVIPGFSSCSKPLVGSTKVPGDKSISHRSIILGALAIGETRVHGLLESADVLGTIDAMTSLGAEIKKNRHDSWSIFGVGVGGFSEPKKVIDFGNSGTGVRLVLGAIATSPIVATCSGDRSLSLRPMGRVLEPLQMFGASNLSRSGGFLPLTLAGAKNPIPITYVSSIPSAQVKSAVLLASLNAPGETVFKEPSRSRDHTERMLKSFGAEISSEIQDSECVISCNGYAELNAQEVFVPGDPSSAAFPICAALMVEGSKVKILNVCQNDTRNGLVITLKEMGAKIHIENERNLHGEPVADLLVTSSDLKGIDVPAERVASMIDEYPILAVVAANADGKTVMRGLRELRVKESDRIYSMAKGLSESGVKIEETEDSLTVYGNGPGAIAGGAKIKTFYDHRIAMSFLCLGLVTRKPIMVDDCKSIETSFPNFISLMKKLGASIELRIENES